MYQKGILYFWTKWEKKGILIPILLHIMWVETSEKLLSQNIQVQFFRQGNKWDKASKCKCI